MRVSSQKSQLLFVGNEPMLSKASAELLKRVGFKVRTTSPLHAAHALRDVRYAAVILCATLSGDEAESVIQSLNNCHAGVPVVSIHLGLLGDAPNPNSSIIVDALNGPEALIGAVESVTRSQTRTIFRAI
jgi:DNA-binding NtrC family response regulator